ncbi:hypothetical protein TWF696_006829 [Orbilia brochopaga]|uniref:Uncharacterized protein n=1 Tax=Orbilia brochopaga TaxID=3140254 RepID=A0AAV9UQS4_9PEZI
MGEQQLLSQHRDFIHTFFESLGGTAKENPHLLAAAIPVVTTFSLPAILNALGFAATGPVAGSLAAAWQASIGSVPAGHLFALIQSISMTTGSALAIGAGIGLVAAVSILIGYIVTHELAKNGELRGMIEHEIGKFGETVAATAVSIGANVGQFVNSPEVQARVEDVRRTGEAAVQGASWFFGGLMQGKF